MLRISAILCLCLLVTQSACESPTDVPAARERSIANNLLPATALQVSGEHMSPCPTGNRYTVRFTIEHVSAADGPFTIESLDVFSEEHDLVLYLLGASTLTVNAGEKVELLAFLHDNGNTIDQLQNLEVTLILNGTHSKTTAIDMLPEEYLTSVPFSGSFTEDGSEYFYVPLVHSCNESWVITEYVLDDPSGKFTPNFPALPIEVFENDSPPFFLIFDPASTGRYRASLTVSATSERGIKMTFLYHVEVNR